MVPFDQSFSAIVAALVVPTLAGLLIVSWAVRAVRPKLAAAFALGIYFWFFSDTIGDSAYLDVNGGFGGGAEQLALVFLFAIGLLAVFNFDRTTFRPGAEGSKGSFVVPLVVALAVGVHGFGEGAAFSSTAANTPVTSLLDAFGGLSAAGAFVIHKALESMMVGAAYWVYCGDRARNSSALLTDFGRLTAVFVLPGVVGAATAYFLSYDATYVFALGLGTSAYAAVRLANPLFADAPGAESTKIGLAIVLGFLSLYLAALLHS